MTKTAEERAAAKAAKLGAIESASPVKEAVVAPVETVAPVVPEKKSERKVRWDALLAAHEKQNPEKHAARVKEGLTMPDNF